ncbi:MAG: hypothetical protein RBQ92_08155 [Bacteroidales bacterium]|jgi:hypothetical protein|nr:hypothetical protein [Bacteroidales bacterium]
MAKSDSYNKRQVEKRKRAKRKEKMKKRVERKNNPKSSFDEMIAYVDENGVIVSSPPESKKVDDTRVDQPGQNLNPKTNNAL